MIRPTVADVDAIPPGATVVWHAMSGATLDDETIGFRGARCTFKLAHQPVINLYASSAAAVTQHQDADRAEQEAVQEDTAPAAIEEGVETRSAARRGTLAEQVMRWMYQIWQSIGSPADRVVPRSAMNSHPHLAAAVAATHNNVLTETLRDNRGWIEFLGAGAGESARYRITPSGFNWCTRVA